ncbi:unnamed protein product [Peniophora sp. CBMAI 1063]|nr:unnamed protein product [Peniophora sp. CBMAI 1063]
MMFNQRCLLATFLSAILSTIYAVPLGLRSTVDYLSRSDEISQAVAVSDEHSLMSESDAAPRRLAGGSNGAGMWGGSMASFMDEISAIDDDFTPASVDPMFGNAKAKRKTSERNVARAA